MLIAQKNQSDNTKQMFWTYRKIQLAQTLHHQRRGSVIQKHQHNIKIWQLKRVQVVNSTK
jgi:hypothetical protein